MFEVAGRDFCSQCYGRVFSVYWTNAAAQSSLVHRGGINAQQLHLHTIPAERKDVWWSGGSEDKGKPNRTLCLDALDFLFYL